MFFVLRMNTFDIRSRSTIFDAKPAAYDNNSAQHPRVPHLNHAVGWGNLCEPLSANDRTFQTQFREISTKTCRKPRGDGSRLEGGDALRAAIQA
jgi:hypothetical protein